MLLKKTTNYLYLAIGFAVFCAVMLALIPFCDNFGRDNEQWLSIVAAALFWVGMIAQQYFFWTANKGRKIIQQKAFSKSRLPKKTIGVFAFFKNREGMMADILMGVALITTIVLAALDVQNDKLVAISLLVLLLSFNLHCIFNGTNYRYVKVFYKMKKETRKREKS